jgi:hypothetical protein
MVFLRYSLPFHHVICVCVRVCARVRACSMIILNGAVPQLHTDSYGMTHLKGSPICVPI